MGRPPGAQLFGAFLDLGRQFWMVESGKRWYPGVPKRWYRLQTRVRTVCSMRVGDEFSGAIEALVVVVVVWANQRSCRHFYVFLRCAEVSPNETPNDGRRYEGKDLRPPGLCAFHPRGRFRTLQASRHAQKVSLPLS
jgi:hypothetical protein